MVGQNAIAREILQTAFGSIVRLTVSQYTKMMTLEQRAAVVRYNKAAADYKAAAGLLDEQRLESLRSSYHDLYTVFGLHDTPPAKQEEPASVAAVESESAADPAAANRYSGLAIMPPEALRQPASFAGDDPAAQPSTTEPLSLGRFTNTPDNTFLKRIRAGNSKINAAPRRPVPAPLMISTVSPVALPVYDLNENRLDAIDQAWQEQETDRTFETRSTNIYSGIRFKPNVRRSFVPKSRFRPTWLPDIIDETPTTPVAIAKHPVGGGSQTIHNHANAFPEADAPAPKPIGPQRGRTIKIGASANAKRPLAEIAKRAGRKFTVVKSGKGSKDFRFEMPDETQLKGYKAIATLWSRNHTPEENLEALIWLRNRTKEERRSLAALMPERIPILEEMLARMFPSSQVICPSMAAPDQILRDSSPARQSARTPAM